MRTEQLKSEDLRRAFMMNVHNLVSSCTGKLVVTDYDVAKNSMLTRYLVQELGPDNIFMIIKAAPSNVEFDIKPIRDNFPNIECSHLYLISAHNKGTVLEKLHIDYNREIVLIKDFIKTVLEKETTLPYIICVHLTDLIA